MYVDFLKDRFAENANADALVWDDRVYKYKDLSVYWQESMNQLNACIPVPMVVAVEADFSPHAAAILLTLIELGCVVVPLTESVAHKKDEFMEVAEVEAVIKLHKDDSFSFEKRECTVKHKILCDLKEAHHPGLVLFSSGSTGKSKAAVHDFVPLLEKFKVKRKCMRMVTFLLFDHIGGINTLLYVLSNTGCIITLPSRVPETVCEIIEQYHVEVLPTSPTFMNLLLISEAYKKYDLSSLQMVTYGTEVMPESTLQRFHELFPKVRLLQTYGLSEIGIMRSKSKSSDSLWVKIGGEDFQTRVIDGLLEVRARSAMLGYLNAPSPFTEDGWFKTGDEVIVDGEYMKILGRKSELINVGGQKVYPAEVESVLQEINGVEDVAVNGESNLLMGQIVKARVKLNTGETTVAFKKRMREYCQGKLESYKIPQKVVLVEKAMYGERFKKMRRE